MSIFLENSAYIFDNPIVSMVLLVYLVVATYTDIKYLKIYDKFNLSLVFTRIIFLFLPVYGVRFSFDNIIASLLVFVTMLAFGVIFMHKMGGDIKFLTAFMLFFNVEFMLIFMTTASVCNLLYSLLLKAYLLKERKKALEENKKECENSIGTNNLLDKFNYYLIKIIMVKQPTVNELVSMSKKDLNKYKMPFAPFFLISYIVLMVSYHLVK